MTPDEHAHVQKLEGLVKRYRSRIVELKAHQWRPIATAPKIDGELVLLYPSRCWTEDSGDCEVGHWDEFSGIWLAMGPTAEDYTGPTHWMPLPEPPI